MNAKMADLKKCVEALGFTDVKTVLSSGNVVFNAAEKSNLVLAKTLESGMAAHLPRSFPVIIRRVDYLAALLAQNPFSKHQVSSQEKRVVTFLSNPHQGNISLPIERNGTRILAIEASEVFTVYEPNERGPVFMQMIEKTFGKEVTTRTFETVKKCVAS